jgi:hypothetical protein
MPPLPLDIPPGIVRTKSPNAAKGRFVACDHIRFVNGLPEKWRGWRRLIAGQEALLGKARGAVAWSNQYGNQNAAFGTNLKLYALLGGDTIEDITPIRASGTLGADPFAVVEDSTTVTVTDVEHGAIEGDFVTFSGATAGGGITIDGEYQIVSIVDADSYTITHSAAATSTDASTGGASVDYAYQINTGLADAVAGLGWSAGGWSEGTWSTPRAEGILLDLRTWSLSEYGNDLLANPSAGGIYLWQEATDANAEVLTNAPTEVRAMFVTGERYIMALGCLEVSPMTVKWPDRDDPTDWTPSAANTANERTLQSGSKLMGGCVIADGVSLVWSDTSLYLFQYTGDDFIYSDRLIGTGCGLAAPLAFCKVGGVAYWFSGRQAWMYAGGGAVPIPNADDQIDAMVDEMDPARLAKIWAEYDQFNHQVRFHYCALGSEEPNRYVDVNLPGAAGATTDDWVWTPGTWPTPRTTGTVFQPADASSILVDDEGYLYSHNDGLDDDADALDWHLTWGLYAMGQGQQIVDVMGIVPDSERQVGAVTFEVFTKERPNSASNYDEGTTSLGPDDEIADIRVAGRHFSMTARQTGIKGGDIRFGIVSLEVQDAGERR